VEMDCAVAAAYGWADLELGHGFHETKQGVRYTLSEAARREVLGRLLKLNHERYAEEVAAGLHDKKSKSKVRSPKLAPRTGGSKGAGAAAGVGSGDAELLKPGRRDLFDTQLSLGEALE